MAFVVEDGSGMSDATSYVSVADADAYFADYGVPATWPATDPAKRSLLQQATSFIDRSFGERFVGEIVRDAQRLLWPRLHAEDRAGRDIPSNGAGAVPRPVVEATILVAARASKPGGLYLDGSEGEDGGRIVRKKTKIDDLETERHYDARSADDLVRDGVRRIPEAEAAIASVLHQGGVVQNRISR